jgi:hypothetical protein
MPIRINLLAEQQAAEERRRRDPVKRAFWVGGFCVALMLLWSLYLVLEKWNHAQEEADLKDKCRRLETNSVQVITNRTRISEIDRKLALLHQVATNRFLWGPFLNSLQFCGQRDLELLHLNVRQDYIETPEVKPARPGGRFEPATSTERIVATLVAKYSGPSPEQGIEQYKRSLRTDPFLKRCFTNENSLKLAGFPQRLVDPLDPSRAYTQFTLEGAMPERTR